MKHHIQVSTTVTTATAAATSSNQQPQQQRNPTSLNNKNNNQDLEDMEGSTIMAAPPQPSKHSYSAIQPPNHQPYDASMGRHSASTQIGVRVEREVQKLAKQCRMLGGEEETKEGEEEPETRTPALPAEPDEVPLFDRNEIMAWSLLGNGAFSEVYQIWGFRLDDETGETIRTPEQDAARQHVKDTAMDSSNRCNYVLKHLRNDLFDSKDKSRFVHAASDLVMEALFLSKLDHPNIIKLRGTSHGIENFGDGEHDGFFLILDRLDCTLSDKIQHWARHSHCRQKIYSRNLGDYAEKVDLGMQIARGLDFLHDRDIIYRDLKPDNIGIQNGVVKIFDFGLCRELPEECPVENKVFHMSGVGTRRYMAPEIFLTQHYNLKVDVYSFAIVLHNMLSLARPFEKFNAQLHTLLVCKEGVRPKVPHEWPGEIRDLLRSGWAHNPCDRPTIKEARQTLERLAVRASNASQYTSHISSPRRLVMPSILESSLQVIDKVTQNLCEVDAYKLNTKAGNVLRAMEMQMIEGGLTPSMTAGKNCFRTGISEMGSERAHYRHLRSSYL